MHIPGGSVGKGADVCCPKLVGLVTLSQKHHKSFETVKSTSAPCFQKNLLFWGGGAGGFVWTGSVLGRPTKCTFHYLFEEVVFPVIISRVKFAFFITVCAVSC